MKIQSISGFLKVLDDANMMHTCVLGVIKETLLFCWFSARAMDLFFLVPGNHPITTCDLVGRKGGHHRACRGDDRNDNKQRYYAVPWPVVSIGEHHPTR